MRPLVLSLAITAVAACHGGETPPDADEALACMTSMRGDVYRMDLEKPGVSGAYKFALMSAIPAPPARNLNTWVLQISSVVTGAPVTGASLTVTPFMPDHQHGAGAYTPQIQELATPGQYQVTDINTWMPGYWEITISATSGTVQDSVVYKFCIQA